MPPVNKTNKPKLPVSKHNGRPIVYPEVKCLLAFGPKATTAQQAKSYLGWCTNPDEAKAAGLSVEEPLLTDNDGVKVWCLNNITNRPLYESVWRRLVQEHLNFRWRLNAEPIIIGETGLLLNGQHCLISLVIAEQIRTGAEKLSWEARGHTGPITMAKIIAFGIEESDDVVNTMDTAKSRTLTEVIYRSQYFKDMGIGKRKQAAKLADHAIRMMWSRTGMGLDAFSPQRTHAESLAFANNHPRLFECVRKILDLDAKKGISNRLPAGYASALMYLMGASATDDETYYQGPANERSESGIDFSNFDKAYELWTLLAKGDSRIAGVSQAFAVAQESGEYGSINEKIAILVNTWHEFLDLYDSEGDIKVNAVKLNPSDYHTDGEAQKHLMTTGLLFGGIDRGDSKFEKKAKAYEAKSSSASKGGKAAKTGKSQLDDNTDEEGETIVAGDEDDDGVFDLVDGEEEVNEEELALIEERKAEIEAKKQKKMGETKKVAHPFIDIFRTLKEQHPGVVLLFEVKEGYSVWGGDAVALSDLGVDGMVKHSNGLQRLTFTKGELQDILKRLIDDGRTVSTVGEKTKVVNKLYDLKEEKAKLAKKSTDKPVIKKPVSKSVVKPVTKKK